MIDLSGIHTCPNCNAKPRCTGQKVIGFGTTVGPQARPVKIRCSNKNCELSRYSVPTEFWQAINRSGAEELQKAFSQFRESLSEERRKFTGVQEVLDGIRRHFDNNRDALNSPAENYNKDFQPLFLAMKKYYLGRK